MAFLFGPTIREGICLLVRERSAGGRLQVWNSITFDGVRLAEFTLGSPAFNLPSDATITATAITPTTVLATGEAQAWRILSTTNAVVLTGTVGGPNSGADWEMETEDALLLQNQTLAVNGFSYTAPL